MSKRASRKRHVYRKYGMSCYICGVGLTEDTKSIDHVKPKYRGGSDSIQNKRPCCVSCNQEKRNMTIAGYTVNVLMYKAIDLLPRGVRIPLDCVQ